MVLLNGVKYACERCIRGHRASSCVHTDKPLTMIKPKGRPTSQCTHCREQRKVNNVHNLCNCGKKGKAPGQHLSSCLCHKSSHCTCANKEKKVASKKTTKAPVMEESANGEIKQEFSGFSIISENPEPEKPLGLGVKKSPPLLMDDMNLHFEASNGLLDYLSSSETDVNYRDSDFELRPSNSDHIYSMGESMLNSENEQRPFNHFPHPPTDAELDLMENMFPLFPLVGSNSFEKDQSLPLSGLTPHDANSSFPNHVDSGVSNGASDLSAENSSLTNLHDAHNSHPASTYHPRPIKPAISSGSTSQNFRPRRAESVLSVASTSSNTSKHNLFDTPSSNLHHFPKNGSAAFPPFNLSENNSHDDLSPLLFNSNDTFNENRPSSILSDFDAFRNGHNKTPSSASPSRRPSQTRRKASLQRSHSSLHRTSVSKDPHISALKMELSESMSHPRGHTDLGESRVDEEPILESEAQEPSKKAFRPSGFAFYEANITAESLDSAYQNREPNLGLEETELKSYEDFLQGIL